MKINKYPSLKQILPISQKDILILTIISIWVPNKYQRCNTHFTNFPDWHFTFLLTAEHQVIAILICFRRYSRLQETIEMRHKASETYNLIFRVTLSNELWDITFQMKYLWLKGIPDIYQTVYLSMLLTTLFH